MKDNDYPQLMPYCLSYEIDQPNIFPVTNLDMSNIVWANSRCDEKVCKCREARKKNMRQKLTLYILHVYYVCSKEMHVLTVFSIL